MPNFLLFFSIVSVMLSLSKETKFKYLIVMLASFIFFTTVVNVDTNVIVAVIVAGVFIYILNETSSNDIQDTNTKLHYKLVSLLQDEDEPTPDYLYLEPDIINFFYDIRDFRVYNRESYVKAIKAVDSMLKIKLELENNYKYVKIPKLSAWQNFGDLEKPKVKNNIVNFKANFENAEVASNTAINHIHSFAVSLPVGIHTAKHEKALEVFHLLVKRVLDEILHVCKASSSDPLIGQNYGLPKPAKEKYNSFDFIET